MGKIEMQTSIKGKKRANQHNRQTRQKRSKPVLEQVLNPIRCLNLPVPSRKDPAIVQFLKRIDKFLQRTYIPKRQTLRDALEIPAYKPMLLAKDHHSRRLVQSSPGFESFRKQIFFLSTLLKSSLCFLLGGSCQISATCFLCTYFCLVHCFVLFPSPMSQKSGQACHCSRSSRPRPRPISALLPSRPWASRNLVSIYS